MIRRSSKGYTILEIMVVISIIGGLTALLFFYSNQGWKGFFKAFQFSTLELNARSALETMVSNIRQCDRDMVFIDDNYIYGVPFPKDLVQGKPYVYFARPNYTEGKINNYDYYLYYIAKAKGFDGDIELVRKAKLKMLIFKNQSAEFTEENADDWPFLPYEMQKTNKPIEDMTNVLKGGFLGKIKDQSLTPEFSLYKSNFQYDYFLSPNEVKSLISIKVSLFDEMTNTKMEFQTSINPRN